MRRGDFLQVAGPPGSPAEPADPAGPAYRL